MGRLFGSIGAYGLMGFGGLLMLGGIGLVVDGDPDGFGSLFLGALMAAGGLAWRVRRARRAKLLAAGAEVLEDVAEDYAGDLVRSLQDDRAFLRELDGEMERAGVPLNRRDDILKGLFRQVAESANEKTSLQLVAGVVMTEAARVGVGSGLEPAALRARAREALAPIRSSMIGVLKAAARKAVADVVRGEAQLRGFRV